MMPRVEQESVIVAAADQVSADMLDETVILGLKDGIYYGLSDVGARVWQLVREPRSVGEVRDVLVEEYEVDPDRCLKDLLELFRSLADRDLIDVRN